MVDHTGSRWMGRHMIRQRLPARSGVRCVLLRWWAAADFQMCDVGDWRPRCCVRLQMYGDVRRWQADEAYMKWS